jgi:hypothetical protein
VLPCNLLYYSVNGSQVFRSEPVSPPAPPLLAGDTATAADHLPVFLSFRDPSNVPMAIRGPTVSNEVATLRWTTIRGERYCVESSLNLAAWQSAVANLVATTNELSVQIPAVGANQFFRLAREC